MLNFEKIKNQVKDSAEAFSSGIDIMEITSLVMILVILCNICGLLFWTTGQNWINWGIGIFILIGFWFTFKKIKTMKQPPLLAVESKEGNPFFEHFLYQNDEISDQDSVNLLGVNDDQDFLARDGQQMENGTCVSDIICDESTKEVKD